MKPKITVVGSLNIDVVVKCAARPKPGETVMGEYHRFVPGGKGANQASASASLGSTAAIIGCVGDDQLGRTILDNLSRFDVDSSGVEVLEGVPSGAAFITVDERGENSIIVSGGANLEITPDMIDRSSRLITGADAVLVQLETPLPVVERAMQTARDAGVLRVVNPAPAGGIPEGSILWESDIFVVNEHEAEFYTGIPVKSRDDAVKAASRLIERGIGTVIVTLGEEGSVALSGDTRVDVDAVRVRAVDTTAAGDTYIGGFCTEYVRIGDLPAAMRYASTAAAISVSRFGAQTSIPAEEEVRNYHA
jgi:ribokinase